ncbi:hypothetical protein ACMGGA_05930 [Citrobacter sp. BNK-39]|uniref:Uncharacterized protein n=1 Tax=Citrobacter portucalensis TaxID=1639133 RepID=A0ABD5GSM3_9ENTR|nr:MULTISPECIES: hypothetical protein [Citrobacter]EGS5523119.1 hypothetical protein [Citrobacter freundii]EHL6941984.1 hypothetical protein [Citrobacter freundii]EHL6950505.1 hypothetical protein [Citrobacter freundii]MBJ8707906.1 hypothetical protein [Citrobacter freundii]MCY3417287.1 hypothetical protein [Citrobacter freundii]
MKQVLSFLIWVGIALAAFLAITSTLSNLILMFSVYPDSIADKYAYMFIFGRWTFTATMILTSWLLYRLTKN